MSGEEASVSRTEQEIKAYALERNWRFIRVPALPLGGYWRNAEGRCFYVRVQEDKERGK